MARAVDPVLVVDLFPELRRAGVEMLGSLTPDEWSLPTSNPGWSVHDVALHLVGGLLANVSRRRDGHPGNFASFTPDGVRVDTYTGLVETLNAWNETWVHAGRRISPRLTIDMLDVASQQLGDYFRTLDLAALGDPIGWAGSAPAPIWLDVAREYTELWTHLAQIREATGRDLVDAPEFFAPVVATFVHGIPYALRDIDRPIGTSLKVIVTGAGGGEWWIERTPGGWVLASEGENPGATMRVDSVVAWRLGTKGVEPDNARPLIEIDGDADLGAGVLNLVAILA